LIESLRAVSSLIISFFILMVGFGVANYVVPLRALGEGWTATDIAQIGAVYSVGYTLASFITPRFIRATGHIRVANIAMMIISILLCSLVTEVWAWMLFRGLFGFAIAGTYMILESWLNEKASNEYRGFMFSVYMITAMTGSIAGTYVTALGDTMTTTLFIISALILASAVFPIALTDSSTPAVATAGAWMNFSAVYARMSGLTETGGANLIAAVTIGSIVAQFPLGRASDFVDRRVVMVFGCVIGIVAGVWLALLDGSHEYQLYAAACLAGMAIFPIYSLNVAHANDMAEPGEYVKISSGITVLYGLGIIIGPLLGGQAIALAGARGLPIVIVIFFAIYAAYAGYRIVRRPAATRILSPRA
jgi:MFS family permease